MPRNSAQSSSTFRVLVMQYIQRCGIGVWFTRLARSQVHILIIALQKVQSESSDLDKTDAMQCSQRLPGTIMKDQLLLHSAISMIIMILASVQGSQSKNELLPLRYPCSCLGSHLAFECAVTGEAGATIWRGSIFQCLSTNNTITLRHSVFTQRRGCNNGAITARGISSQNSRYISLINITTSSSMNNRTVECVYNNGSAASVVGTSMVTVISDPLPPPNNVSILTINSTQLAFGWNPVAAECPTIYYSTDTTGCGICENTTYLPMAYCTEIPKNKNQVCSFAIRTNACNGMVGNKSKAVSILLQTPDAPVVDIIPMYTQTRKLSAIMTTFHEVEGFNISIGIDGSAHSYQISYTDSVNGFRCHYAIIPAQSCINGTCKHLFDAVSLMCPNSNDIIVTVSGFNRLGEGSMSNPVVVPVTNQFFMATFDIAHNRVVCTFLVNSQQHKSCSLTYGKQSCSDSSQSSGSGSNIVLIGLPSLDMQSHGAMYCYTLTASNGTHTVIIKGTFVPGFSNQPCTCLTELFIGIIVVSNVLLIIVIITILTTVILKRKIHKECDDVSTSQVIYEEVQNVNSNQQRTIDTEKNEAYVSTSVGL